MGFAKEFLNMLGNMIKDESFEEKKDVSYETTQKGLSTVAKDLILLSLASNFKIDEVHYPEYLRDSYGIGFPREKLHELEKQGYLRVETPVESLKHLKVSDLKAIASDASLKVTGKKEDIIQRIRDSVSEEKLAKYICERHWCLTSIGEQLLKENPFIGFYLEKHPYRLEEIGLDLVSYVKLFDQKPNSNVRDTIWGEMNKLSLKYYKEGISKREFGNYCCLLRVMSLFLKEEKKYKQSLEMYGDYIFYDANFNAALKAIKNYAILKDVNSAADSLYYACEIMPFTANEIMDICNLCGYSSSQLYEFFLGRFKEKKDKRIFSDIELADLVMYGLNGDREGQKRICKNVIKTAIKTM